jgi:hypothetical protein
MVRPASTGLPDNAKVFPAIGVSLLAFAVTVIVATLMLSAATERQSATTVTPPTPLPEPPVPNVTLGLWAKVMVAVPSVAVPEIVTVTFCVDLIVKVATPLAFVVPVEADSVTPVLLPVFVVKVKVTPTPERRVPSCFFTVAVIVEVATPSAATVVGAAVSED